MRPEFIFAVTCECLKVVYFFETFIMQVQDVVQLGSTVVELEVRPHQLLQELLATDSFLLLLRLLVGVVQGLSHHGFIIQSVV